MKVSPGSGPVSFHPWFFGAIALLALPACTTTRLAEEEQPSNLETVEIGYGAVHEDHFVGSVVTTQSGEAQAVQFKTLAEMLNRLPGVRVIELHGGGISVRIRGATSFLSSEEPLFVLDGMALQSTDEGLRGINPNTIESLTVLKDAAETAIYGSRGANGVILIKTKGGSK